MKLPHSPVDFRFALLEAFACAGEAGVLGRAGEFIGPLPEEFHQAATFAGGGEHIRGERLANLDAQGLAHAAAHLAKNQREAQLQRQMAGDLKRREF